VRKVTTRFVLVMTITLFSGGLRIKTASSTGRGRFRHVEEDHPTMRNPLVVDSRDASASSGLVGKDQPGHGRSQFANPIRRFLRTGSGIGTSLLMAFASCAHACVGPLLAPSLGIRRKRRGRVKRPASSKKNARALRASVKRITHGLQHLGL
jgi:hypothetical protein